jgi:hypothetical protein
MMLKIRRIKHRLRKFFGYPEDKWARGMGKDGYGRNYGRHRQPMSSDYLTLEEKRMSIRNREDLEDYASYSRRS